MQRRELEYNIMQSGYRYGTGLLNEGVIGRIVLYPPEAAAERQPLCLTTSLIGGREEV